jgi:hypothetical protein
MRIEFQVEGGVAAFPGLAKPVSIDCERLPPEATARLHDLVRQADFFALPRDSTAPTAPDARRYTIVVDDGTRCSTVTVSEPIANPALRDLVAELRAHARHARSRA